MDRPSRRFHSSVLTHGLHWLWYLPSCRALWEFGLYPAPPGRLVVGKGAGLRRSPVLRAIIRGDNGRVTESEAREEQLGG